jgi:hypothetical protein
MQNFANVSEERTTSISRIQEQAKQSVENGLHGVISRSFRFNFVTFLYYYWWGGTESLGIYVPGTAATLAYCTNPDDRWRWFLEQLVEWRLAGETEVLRENLPQRHFVHHKIPHNRPSLEPRTAAVGSQRLTAWAMARPYFVP